MERQLNTSIMAMNTLSDNNKLTISLFELNPWIPVLKITIQQKCQTICTPMTNV